MPRAHRYLTCLPVALLACGPTESTKPVAPPEAPTTPTAPKPAEPAEPAKPAQTEPTPEPAKPLDPQIASSVADSVNGFAVDLHRALAGKPGNLFVSPASITLAFAMTHAGARGETEQEIARVFHFGADPVKLREGFAAALAGWSAPQQGRELAVANRLYGEKKLKFEAPFLTITRTTFGAALEPTDFVGDAEGARGRINTWVAERTRDKIKDLLPPRSLDELTRLVLVNAVYFKADWQTEFSPDKTRPAPFHGAKRPAELMERTGQFAINVVADAKLKVLELPYRGGFSLVVVLPDADAGLARIEKDLSAAKLTAWISGLRAQEVAVKLPRFKIEPGESLELAKILAALGMPSAFDERKADLSGMAPRAEQLYLSAAFHKAFVAVDEKGTEAAAATAVVASTRGMALPKPDLITFTADHPFLFLIRDQQTGTIVFMGRLVEP